MSALVFDHLLLGAGTVFDTRRRPMATRLTVHPLDSLPASASESLALALAELWPESFGPLWLNLTHEATLHQLLEEALPPHIALEVPAFLAGDPDWAEMWQRLQRQKTSRILKGRPLTTLSADVIQAFSHAIVERQEDRRLNETAPSGVPRTLAFVQAGNLCAFDATDSYRRGAVGVLGWPLGDAPDAHSPRREIPAGVNVVLELMQKVEQDAPPEQLEAVLRRAPALAYRLMRFINSPAFGLSVEINSFQHAVMVLGTQRLKRWLALLVTGAVDDPELKPLMFLAVRRGLLMEELAREQGDEALRNELFICGVFSLLDRMLGQPFEALLSQLPVPTKVSEALAQEQGPLRPWLEAAIAVEMESPYDIQAAIDNLMLSPADLNRAVLTSLRNAWQMRDE